MLIKFTLFLIYESALFMSLLIKKLKLTNNVLYCFYAIPLLIMKIIFSFILVHEKRDFFVFTTNTKF